MPTALVVKITSRAGLSLAAQGTTPDITNNTWVSVGNEVLVVANNNGAPITLTLDFGPGALVDGQTPPNRTVVVANGDTVEIGPFPPSIYASAGVVTVAWSAVTGVKCMVVRLGS